MSSAINPPNCPHCGQRHETTCPTIKAIEYYPDGTVKRVEFKAPADYFAPRPGAPLPPYPLTLSGKSMLHAGSGFAS